MANPRQPFIDSLLKGETVKFRACGNSMTPRIPNKSLLTLEAIKDYTSLKNGNAVLCKVRKNVFVHLITGVQGKDEKLQFQISNNHGRVNGWTSYKNIYGKLILVES